LLYRGILPRCRPHSPNKGYRLERKFARDRSTNSSARPTGKSRASWLDCPTMTFTALGSDLVPRSLYWSVNSVDALAEDLSSRVLPRYLPALAFCWARYGRRTSWPPVSPKASASHSPATFAQTLSEGRARQYPQHCGEWLIKAFARLCVRTRRSLTTSGKPQHGLCWRHCRMPFLLNHSRRCAYVDFAVLFSIICIPFDKHYAIGATPDRYSYDVEYRQSRSASPR
jgi:hypothetical protein